MLSIRNPRALELARTLAGRRNITLAQAVIEALEHELEAAVPLHERVFSLLDTIVPLESITGRDLTKDEIDDMWGM